jgi:prepilin-type processing-associated H-X9-DG protein
VTASSFIKSGGTSSQYLMADGSVTTGGGGGVDELQDALISQVYG